MSGKAREDDPFSFSTAQPASPQPTPLATPSAAGGSQTLVASIEAGAPLTANLVRHYLRSLGITETILIQEQDFQQFLEERGIQELGRGGEGCVYFLRGYVAKIAHPESVAAALREVAHMLFLNGKSNQSAMGDRMRDDWPSLIWVYTLSNGALCIGMKPFDLGGCPEPGRTLHDRLWGGPIYERAQVLRDIVMLGQSLLYCHRRGIIHHDLKPANIYIPSDPHQKPVIFDLGQAIWKQNSWGRQWLRHNHNVNYWYNGTYRYMQLQRRMAHLGALAAAHGKQPTARETEAFSQYVPSFYDDVFSFAYILREITRSQQVGLRVGDRTAIKNFQRKLMGLERKTPRQPRGEKSTSLVGRLLGVFGKPPTPPPETKADRVEIRYASMEQVQPELERMVAALGD